MRLKGALHETMANIDAGAVAFLLPVVFRDFYYDIDWVKCWAFLLITAFALCAWVIALVRDRARGIPLGRLRCGFLQCAPVLAFTLLAMLSGILSPYRMNTLWGEAGRGMGILAIGALCAQYVILSRSVNAYRAGLAAFLFTGAFCGMLGVLNAFYIDPLGFYNGVPRSSARLFLSTIGNRDFFCAYACMLFPLSAGLFLRVADRRQRTVCAAIVPISFAALLASRSDAAWLGILTVVCVLMIAPPRDRAALARLPMLLFLCAMAALLLQGGAYLRYGRLPVPSSYSGALLSSPLPLVTAALAFFMSFYKPSASALRRIRVALLAALALLALAVAVLIVYYTSNADTPLPNIPIIRHLRLNDSWGAWRGYAWRKAWFLFCDASPLQKLLGIGPETVRLAFEDGFYWEMVDLTGKSFDAVHNEYLQLLLTQGVAGLAAYLTLLLSSVRMLIRKSRTSAAAYAVLLAVLAYAAQAFVGIAQPATTPLFWLLLALRFPDDQSPNPTKTSSIKEASCRSTKESPFRSAPSQ